jgi:hypothetical protein
VIGLADVVLVCSAWRRPEYLERTLASWVRVRGVGKLAGLVVPLGPSDVEARQREIIHLAPLGLRDKTVIRPDSPAAAASPGMHRALGEALAWVSALSPHGWAATRIGASRQPKAVICAEEDQVVSDDVLEYMLWALNRFEGDPLVAAVCAHDVGGQGWDIPGIGTLGADADQAAVALSPYFNPWVWATWCGPKLDMLLGTWDWDADQGDHPNRNGYDWGILRQIRDRGLLAVVPAASRSQNIGRDGGYYARPELFDQTQAASFRKHRDPLTYHLIGEPDG